MGSFPSHIDLILPEPLILEANTHRVLEWKAPYEIKPSGFQTGVRSFSSRTGSLRTVARGASLLPTANFSPRDSTFICSVSRGHVFFFFFFFRKEGFLSVLVMVALQNTFRSDGHAPFLFSDWLERDTFDP